MTRLADWDRLLDAFLQENLKRPFEFGTWDCGLFTAGAIQAMTGVDLAETYRGTYHSEEEAKALGTPEEIVGKSALADFGCEPNFAHRGDLVLLSNPPLNPCLGILGLDGRAIMATDEGLTWVPRERVLKSWHV